MKHARRCWLPLFFFRSGPGTKHAGLVAADTALRLGLEAADNVARHARWIAKGQGGKRVSVRISWSGKNSASGEWGWGLAGALTQHPKISAIMKPTKCPPAPTISTSPLAIPSLPDSCNSMLCDRTEHLIMNIDEGCGQCWGKMLGKEICRNRSGTAVWRPDHCVAFPRAIQEVHGMFRRTASGPTQARSSTLFRNLTTNQYAWLLLMWLHEQFCSDMEDKGWPIWEAPTPAGDTPPTHAAPEALTIRVLP